MDFHSLTRKDLQTLCKKNKIPANITNVAMADALKALEIVEGLDEFMNQSQSPEKTMNKSSQEIPSTVARTSTRRKTTKEEPQSIQPTTRTRRTTRRTMELNEENKNVNVPETPVTTTTTRRRAQKTEPEVEVLKKSDLLETPALQSGRKRPGVRSTRGKAEVQKEEGTMQQQGYGTRRSVRLLEKCMTGLSLKENERVETVKIDEMVEEAVGEDKNGQSGATSEVPLARNLSASLEDESDLKDDILENNECNNGKTDCTVISEADSHKSDNLDCFSAVDTKDSFPNGKTDEPEGEDKLADIPNEIKGPKGSHDAAVSEDLNEELVADNNGGSHADEPEGEDKLADIPNEIKGPKGSHDVAVSEDLNEELIADNNRGSHADETMSTEVLVADSFEDISEEILDHSSSAQEIECQKLVGKDCDINALHDGLTVAEEDDEGKVFPNVSVLPNGHLGSSERMGNEESDDEPDEIVPESNIVDAFLGDSDINDDDTGSDKNSSAGERQEDVSFEQNSICIPTAAYSFVDHSSSAQEIEYQKLVGKDCDINSLHDGLTVAQEDDEGKVFPNLSVLPNGHLGSSERMGNEESDDEPDEIVPESNIVDAFLGDSDIDDDDTGSDKNSSAGERQEDVSCEQNSICIPTAAYTSVDPMTNVVDEAALIEVNVTDAETIPVSSFHNAPQSVVNDDIPVHKMLDYGDEEALVDVCVKPAEEFADNTAMEILPEEKSPTAAKLMSGITTSIPLSPLTAQFSQPTRFTPRKSSTKKQITIPKVTQVSDNNNKENVDNSSAKEVVEPSLGKVKKNKNIIDEETMQKLESMSLRNLKKLNKMFEKLQITDNMKNKEDKIDNKQQAFGKARPALQTLQQNCIRTGEAEKQN